MNKSLIFIFNAPPRSGKDSLFLYLKEKLNIEVHHREFKSKLKEIALICSGIDKSIWDKRYELYKDEPWNLLNGLSQREFLMLISEKWIKPALGKDYFGKNLASSINEPGVYIVTDGGFSEEILPLTTISNVDIYICQWSRVDSNSNLYTFDKDSRSYIEEHRTKYKIVYLPTNEDLDTWLEASYRILASYIEL